MANPGILQGTVNRLRANIVFPNFPGLNITPSYLGREAIRIAPSGVVTTSLPTLTGRVTSPEPYQMLTITVHLLRSQSFADEWKQQIESVSSLLGDFTVRPDAATLSPYYVNNGSIDNWDPLAFAGGDAGFTITLSGTYNINAALWP